MTPKQIIQAGRDIANKTEPESISQTDVGTPIEQIGIYLKNIDRLDVQKADKSEINTILKNFSLGIIYKGESANEAAIKALQNSQRGDTYKAADTGHYWCYDGKSWNDVGVVIPSDTAIKEDVDYLTELPLANMRNNAVISPGGGYAGISDHAILAIINPVIGGTYRIKTTALNGGGVAKLSYAFFSGTNMPSESNFISGSETITQSINMYDDIIVPDNPNIKMLCISTNLAAPHAIYRKDISLLDVTDANRVYTDKVNNRIVPAIFGNETAYNLVGTQLIYPCTQYNDMQTTGYSSSPYSQLNPWIMQGDYKGDIIKTEVNGQKALRFKIAPTANPRNQTITVRIRSQKEQYITFCARYDTAIEDKLYFVPTNGSGGVAPYNFKTGKLEGVENNGRTASMIYKDSGIIIWSTTKPAATDQSLGFGNISGLDTYIDLFNVIVSDKPINLNNIYNSIPEINNSHLLGKNVMVFGDSNLQGSIGMALMEQLGCSVYRNSSGSRAMKYRSGQTAQSDLSWLYHWSRRKFIQDCKTAYLDLSAFIFFASYNDTSGGELSDAAIKAVMDNYPVIGDDEATVAAKLALFNAMTENQRLSIFTYKACFAAYLKQLISLYPAASVYLTTMLYSPSTDITNPDTQRAKDKATRDAINNDIRDIAAWFGCKVIDNNSAASYYYGNMIQQGSLKDQQISDLFLTKQDKTL